MPLDEVRPFTLHFPPHRNDGPSRNDELPPFGFPREIASAVAIMTGWELEYRDEGDPRAPTDHWVGLLQAEVHTTLAGGSAVVVDGRIGLRDKGGFPGRAWGNYYAGTISGLVLVELVGEDDLPSPALTITGVETTQVTQFFRSNVRATVTLPGPYGGSRVLFDHPPDNSVPLVEGKPTAIRVYVDYERLEGQPMPTSLTGILEVSGSSGVQVLTSLNAIVPRPDWTIDRRRLGDTLNFVLPAGLCRGELGLRVQAVDATSGIRTARHSTHVRFQQGPSLRVFLVGLSLRGEASTTAAPGMAACSSSLDFARKIYPVESFTLDGYQTLERPMPTTDDLRPTTGPDGSINGNPFLHQCNDALRDLQGSSRDFFLGYYDLPAIAGLFPAGEQGVVGLARAGVAGAATAPVGDQRAAAHELTHLVPISEFEGSYVRHTDEDPVHFPRYEGLPPGSIGEIGTDPTAAPPRLLDPATVRDVMDVMAPSRDLAMTWIEPGEYENILNGLQQRGPMRAPGGLTLALIDNDYEHQLMLGLEIDRDRSVHRRPSFHFPAPMDLPRSSRGPLFIELRDQAHKILSAQPVGGDTGPYPLTIRTRVPFPQPARRIVLLDNDRELWGEDIPDPPKLSNLQYRVEEGGFHVEWEVQSPEEDLWFLVHWQDEDGAWRGVAARSQEKHILVPFAFLRNRRTLPVQVLATSGIATGASKVLELDAPKGRAPADRATEPQLLFSISPEQARTTMTQQLAVEAFDEFGRSVSGGTFIWRDESGAQVGAGRTFAFGEGDPLSPVTVAFYRDGALAASLEWPPSVGASDDDADRPPEADGGER